MELYSFGFNLQSHYAGISNKLVTSKSCITASAITILWSSWCDAVIATHSGIWTTQYVGMGLSPSQANHINDSKHFQSLFNTRSVTVKFFGSLMHDGLRGYVISGTEGGGHVDRVFIFATDSEIDTGLDHVQPYDISSELRIMDLKILTAGEVLLGVKVRGTGEDKMLQVQDVTELRACLESGLSSLLMHQSPLAAMVPTQWCMNASTCTALDQDGRLFTCTRDPRFPKCLGRLYDGIVSFGIVPYLSETKIMKIASGGYLSAAVSLDGELYLWGQVCPGSDGKLEVLQHRSAASSHDEDVEVKKSGIFAQGEQDNLVKCLEVYIDGQVAQVYDVAVGHGHVLVAAEVLISASVVKRAVFAAGDNSRGQLSLASARGYVEDFAEVESMRGKHTAQMVAAGWSSFIVTRAG